MLRWLGAGLILCGGLLTRSTLIGGERRAQRTRRELAAAFEAMESEIRLLLTPAPSLLRRAYGVGADGFFGQVSGELTCGKTLAEAWRLATDALPLPENERAAVAALGTRLGGDEAGVCAALRLTAETLRKEYEAREKARAQNERLITSICVSISLFLAVFLI